MGPHSAPVPLHGGTPDPRSRMPPEKAPTDAALGLLASLRARLTHGRAVPSSDENVARLDELAATVGSLRDETAGLRRALTSREDIDEAKGIIIATRGCPREDAFQALVKMSQDSNVPLKEVARALIYQAVDA